jgi:hypothetical protein
MGAKAIIPSGDAVAMKEAAGESVRGVLGVWVGSIASHEEQPSGGNLSSRSSSS